MKTWIATLGIAFVLTQAGQPLSAQLLPNTTPDTVRFLEQATFGPTPSLIASVRAQGFEAFLAEQLKAPMAAYPKLDPVPARRDASCTGTCQRDNYTMYPLQVHFFKNAVTGADQLRQRVAWALSQILVVSGLDITPSSWMRPFQQLLYESAFGNYEELLYDVTRNAAMGRYLDTLNNRCQTVTDPTVPDPEAICRNGSPAKPNENYARELLQLFTIGPELLHDDGTPELDSNGTPSPSYGQETIEEFARALTGWVLAPQVMSPLFGVLVANYSEPMRVSEGRHDRGPKRLLNIQGVPTYLPGDQSANMELRAAISNIMAHQNTAPFISRRLIQHLVTSNPSGQYVADIAGVFRNSRSSPQQLFEVVRAILLHPEARGAFTPVPTGKLREPVLFITNVLRALNGSTDGVLNSIVIDGSPMGSAQMGQNVFTAPSVFNFYSPNHVVPRTDPPLFGPEFQIHSTTSAVRRANFVNQVVFGSIPGTTVDLSPWLKLASSPDDLISSFDMLLLHGTMSAAMRTLVRQAVTAVPFFPPSARIQQAVYLIATSSQYQVQR